jgi:hypothetical protein
MGGGETHSAALGYSLIGRQNPRRHWRADQQARNAHEPIAFRPRQKK